MLNPAPTPPPQKLATTWSFGPAAYKAVPVVPDLSKIRPLWVKVAACYGFGATLMSVLLRLYFLPVTNSDILHYQGLVCTTLLVTGLISAFIALSGLIRHGRKGVLAYTVAGLLIGLSWVGYYLTQVFKEAGRVNHPMTMEELQDLPRVHPDWPRIFEIKYGFSLEIPKSFRQISQSPKPTQETVLYFAREQSAANPDAFTIEPLHAIVDHAVLTPAEFERIKQAMALPVELKQTELTWLNAPITATTFTFDQNGAKREITAVMIPLAKEAVQLNTSFLVEHPGDGLRFTQQLLDGLNARQYVPPGGR